MLNILHQPDSSIFVIGLSLQRTSEGIHAVKEHQSVSIPIDAKNSAIVQRKSHIISLIENSSCLVASPKQSPNALLVLNHGIECVMGMKVLQTLLLIEPVFLFLFLILTHITIGGVVIVVGIISSSSILGVDKGAKQAELDGRTFSEMGVHLDKLRFRDAVFPDFGA